MRQLFAALALVPVLAAPAWAEVVTPTTGRVVTLEGSALSDVFVQQQGAFASAVSDAQGNYALRLDPKGSSTLLFSMPGYMSATVPVASARVVTLKPVPVYRPTFSAATTVEAPAPSAHVYDTMVATSYRVRYQQVTSRNQTVEGLANNELYGLARYRVGSMVLGLDGYRNKVPMVVGNIPQPPSPPSVENSEWNLSVGYDLEALGMEFLPQLVMSNYFIQPGSATPWTGTPLDYAQTRQGFGLNLEAGKRLKCMDLSTRLLLIPTFASTTTSAAPYDLGSLGWGEFSVTVGHDLMPGLQLNASYTRQFGGGSAHGEWANIASVGLSYHPERIQP